MIMKTILISTIVVLSIILCSCSELNKDIPAPVQNTNVVHPQGWANTSSSDFHGTAVMVNNFDIRGCAACHGASFNGGTAGVSCLNAGCHPYSGGPYNCTTCHGFPPPSDRYGNTSNKFMGVGAHTIHITGNNDFSGMQCESCHTLPTSIYDSNHINTTTGRANVAIFDPLSRISSGGVTPVPTYNFNTGRCANTFCHGAWRLTKAGAVDTTIYTDSVMTGANSIPWWTGDSTQTITCGISCHTNPPAGHKVSSLQTCYTCHSAVIDKNGNIIKNGKHVNGMIDLNNTSTPFR
jgi:hypothetical protein